MTTENKQSPNIISPMVNVPSLDFMDKIPSVKNQADLNSKPDEQDINIDYCKTSKSYWSEMDPKRLASYEQGYVAGKHTMYDSSFNSNLWKILTKAKIDILLNLMRTNEKSIKHIKFVIDILNALNDNIEHVMKSEGVKADDYETAAYLHGFINAVVKNKQDKGIED